MRAACIDIGSNTTRLLVAERAGDGLREVHQEREFTRIGSGRSTSGEISADKIAEVVAVVAHQLAVASALGAGTVRAVATAAIRTAANGGELVAAIRLATGLEVEVIAGAEEARLAFVGAVAAVGVDEALVGVGVGVGVVDVGGGSSEIVVGAAPGQVTWWASIPIGSASVTDAHLRADPPLPGEIAAAHAGIRGALGALHPPRPPRAYAVGGSATSLCRVVGPALGAPALDRALAVLAGRPSAQIAADFAVDPRRARLLLAGLLILQAASDVLGVELTVGGGGIREGVLLETLVG